MNEHAGRSSLRRARADVETNRFSSRLATAQSINYLLLLASVPADPHGPCVARIGVSETTDFVPSGTLNLAAIDFCSLRPRDDKPRSCGKSWIIVNITATTTNETSGKYVEHADITHYAL